MSVANADQAGRWNSGEDMAHWIDNQARYDRMNEPFTTLILDAAALRLAATCSTWAAAAVVRRSPPPGSSRRARRSASACPVRCWPGSRR
jgi:hypothetical protein